MTENPVETGWMGRVRRSHIIAVMAALASIIAIVASTTEAIDKIAVWTGIKPDAMQLADNDARAHFSREFSRAAWHRYWLMFRYVALVEGKSPDSDRERLLSKYEEVLEEWNRDLVVNELSLKQYYGDEKRDVLKQRIEPEFSELHACIEGLRTPTMSFRCRISAERDIAAIKKGLHRLRHDIYCLIMGLPEKPNRLSTELFGPQMPADASCAL